MVETNPESSALVGGVPIPDGWECDLCKLEVKHTHVQFWEIPIKRKPYKKKKT